jgi:hypothetical protein
MRACFPAAVVAWLLSAVAAHAQAGHASAGAEQTLTLTSSAQSLTVPTGSVWATLCLETANARWRDDGTAPTASVGVPLTAGQCMQYAGPFTRFQIIAQSGSPVLSVSFYR